MLVLAEIKNPPVKVSWRVRVEIRSVKILWRVSKIDLPVKIMLRVSNFIDF